jgi:hypothetical protein
MSKAQHKRQQINVRTDDEFEAALAELQRSDQSGVRVPSMSDVIRKSVFEARDRLRQRRKK